MLVRTGDRGSLTRQKVLLEAGGELAYQLVAHLLHHSAADLRHLASDTELRIDQHRRGSRILGERGYDVRPNRSLTSKLRPGRGQSRAAGRLVQLDKAKDRPVCDHHRTHADLHRPVISDGIDGDKLESRYAGGDGLDAR